MIGSLARWLDSRTRSAKFARSVMNHVFPDHWSFMLGEIAFYSFVVLVITGTFMALFFDGSSADVIYRGTYRPLVGVHMSAAYQSVLHLSFDVPAGLLVRQMHHWAADIFIGSIVAHLARIYFTAAYRKPRELNWMIGLTLLLFAIVNGFLGYSICDDLLSGAGLRIGYSILLSVPIIGPWLTFLAFGGTIPVSATIPRLYAMHIYLVPAIIATLIGIHLALIWRQMHTNYPGKGRSDKLIVGSRLWPSYTLKSAGLFLFVFGLVAALGSFVQIDPVWIYGPFKADAIIPGAQPDWYLGWVEGAMRLFPGVHVHFGRWLIPELFFPGFLLPCVVFVVLYAFPFIDKLISLDFRAHNLLRLPWEQPFNTALGCAAFAFLAVLFVAGGDDVIAVANHSSIVWLRDLLRYLAFALPIFTGALVYVICEVTRRRHHGDKAAVAPLAVSVLVSETSHTQQLTNHARGEAG